MVIDGAKAIRIKSGFIFEPCPSCRAANKLEMGIYQRYANLYFIPLFPLGKTGISICGACKQVLKLKEMPPSLKIAYENLKAGTKAPLWTFTGLIAIAVCVILPVTIDNKRIEQLNKMALNPQKGDLVELNSKAINYSLLTVQAVTHDSIFFTYALSNTVSKEDEADSLNGVSRTKFVDMAKNGEIISIDRQ